MSSLVRNLIAGTGALAFTGLAFAFAIAPVMVDTAGMVA